LSFFHFWLPVLLVYLVWRLGYDRPAVLAWSLLALIIVFVCYFLLPVPPAPVDCPNLPVNVNYVYGLSDEKPQAWMNSHLYFLMLLAVLPGGIYLPTHLVLQKLFPGPGRPPLRPEPRIPSGKPVRGDGAFCGGNQGHFQVLFALGGLHFNLREQCSTFCLTSFKNGLGWLREHRS
jgi:hypothetical protein